MIHGATNLMATLMAASPAKGGQPQGGSNPALLALFGNVLAQQMGQVAGTEADPAMLLRNGALPEGFLAGEVATNLTGRAKSDPEAASPDDTGGGSPQDALIALLMGLPVQPKGTGAGSGDSPADPALGFIQGMKHASDSLARTAGAAGKGAADFAAGQQILPGLDTAADEAAVKTGVAGASTAAQLLIQNDDAPVPASTLERGSNAVAVTTSQVPLPEASAGQSGLGQEMHLANPHKTAPDVAMPRLTTTVTTPVGHPQWAAEMGDKLVWLAGRQGQVADLVLNPPSLGSVEVRLNLSGNEAGAQFFSANPQVRDAIEAALPRLRELLAGAGLSLGEATVSGQSLAQQGAPGQSAQGRGEPAEPEEGGSLLLSQSPSGQGRGLGLVDLFV